ncbi:MAG: DUF1573 domain-containing protein [Proteobacteria bacterium]|nr:DUF1573 domain-containing protein [Pseudomonadota bacterium]
MKQNTIPVLFMLTVMFLASTCPLHANESADKMPLAFAVEPEFEFQPVVAGKEVLHDFIIRNKGTDVLKIEKVKPG